MNQSCQTYMNHFCQTWTYKSVICQWEWIMSHKRMIYVTQEWVIPHTRKTYLCITCKRGMSCTDKSYHTFNSSINGSYHTNEWGRPHTWISHFTYVNERYMIFSFSLVMFLWIQDRGFPNLSFFTPRFKRYLTLSGLMWRVDWIERYLYHFLIN